MALGGGIRKGSTSTAASLAVSAINITAQFAPIPWLAPIGTVLGEIITICDNVSVYRDAARQLAVRCVEFVKVFEPAQTGLVTESMQEAAREAQRVLDNIKVKMNTYAGKKFLQCIVSQNAVSDDIQTCQFAITDCCSKFQIFAQIESNAWQQEFSRSQKEGHDEIIEYLSNIQHKQDLADERNRLMMQQLMEMMQIALPQVREGDNHAGLSANLLAVQRKAGTLLPDQDFTRGEVIRLGDRAVWGKANMDVWEGLFLGQEKVALKAIRLPNLNEKALRRLRRERSVWAAVYKVDKGKYILPLYGSFVELGFTYLVSPLMSNGNANEYVKANPDMDHRRLIKEITQGIRVLHTMEQPIVHGDLKGSNIIIGPDGNALIADFGLSKMVDDIAGSVSFTQSQGVSESYRWFAFELCYGTVVLSPAADIYAFAMTVSHCVPALELLTHDHPFMGLRRSEVAIELYFGNIPARPIEPVVISRGLNDDMWDLMVRCWVKDRFSRPDIHEVLAAVEAWAS
ncbi:hypothetical protein JAAARDRAFT_78967 [Jaapia argillacea MUCL 33604]|uniref:Protein kinase domain-containing protein n=1 Tax=Jaapia argillacea MUCL 33604 TaxID=933084 RepID=A0A067PTF4_9AGAM|nr:hypothetical protein JAAARDRAFT_78967 [Jaapia argillacea MUCL 33604]